MDKRFQQMSKRPWEARWHILQDAQARLRLGHEDHWNCDYTESLRLIVFWKSGYHGIQRIRLATGWPPQDSAQHAQHAAVIVTADLGGG